MSLEVFGKVSISCEAAREWHQPRDGKRRRRWLAMFVKVPWLCLSIPPDITGDGVLIESREDAPAAEQLEWGSLLIGRSREYRERNIQALISSPMERQQLRSEFGYAGVIDDELMAESYTPFIDMRAENTLTERKTYLPSSMYPFWGHDSDLPDFGYHGARADSRGGKFADWDYRMECPCGYRIRDISSEELHPVLDQLSEGGLQSLSIQRLLRILGRE